jgi:hypothetical protein
LVGVTPTRIAMRVYRVESLPYEYESPRLRENRVGVFSGRARRPVIMGENPGPWSEFPEYVYHDTHFFALPSMEWVRKVMYELDEYSFVAVYEVEPEYVGRTQVIFHNHTARFVGELHSSVLVSCVMLKNLVDYYKSFNPRKSNASQCQGPRSHKATPRSGAIRRIRHRALRS